MPPKAIANPFLISDLHLPGWQSAATPDFSQFVHRIFHLNKSRTGQITRENILQAYRLNLSKRFVNDQAAQDGELAKTGTKESAATLDQVLKRARGPAEAISIATTASRSMHSRGHKPAKRSVDEGLQLPKFDPDLDKTITWSKYVSRLAKANPNIQITPGMADRLLHKGDDLKGMSTRFYSTAGQKASSRGRGMSPEALFKRLELLRDITKAMDAYWESQGVDPTLNC